jgi:hypothetical protein
MLAQDLEERGAVVGDGDGGTVDTQGEHGRRRRRRGVGQLKDEPHPQVRVALGFEMLNPAP